MFYQKNMPKVKKRGGFRGVECVFGILLMFSGVSFATDLTSGLVLNMHLDNISANADTGVYAADSSSYGNGGTISGAAWSASGYVGNSISFDGMNDYVAIPNSASLNIAGTTPYSISLWVKGLGSKNNPTEENPDVETLLSKVPEGSCSGGYFFLYSNYEPKPSKMIRFGFNQGCYAQSYIDSNKSDWESDKWYNIVGTWDGTTGTGSLRLYVNGGLDTSAAAQYPMIMQNTADLWMGAWKTGPNAYFKGQIDEVRIYRRALSANEVRELYNNPDESLVLNLHLDNSPQSGDTQTKAADNSSYKNNATIHGPVWTASGRINSAVSFDGTDDYVSIPHSGSLGLSGAVPFSIDVWVRGINSTSDPSNGETIITKTPVGSCSGGYYIWYDNGRSGEQFKYRLGFGFHHACSQASIVRSNRTNWNPDTWYHIVGTWDGTTNPNTLKLYVNGELDAQQTPQYPTILGNTANLQLGTWGDPTRVDYFKGQMDEVKVYKRALSYEEIKEEYNKGSLIMYMPFDEGNGTTVNDLSSNGHNGLLVNGPSWTTGQKGGAVVFDGSHYVDLGASTWFNRQTFTISLWVNPGTTQLQYADIIDNNHRNDISWVIQQNMDETNKYYWGYSTNGSATHFELKPSVWSHLTVSRDGSSGENKVYINGLLVNSTISPANINYDGTEYLRLGKWGGWLWNGHYREWNGSMDDLKIYDRTLTAEEIKAEYDIAQTTTTTTTTTTRITTTTAASTSTTTSSASSTTQGSRVSATRHLPSIAYSGKRARIAISLDVNESDKPNTVGLTEYITEGWNLSDISMSGIVKASPNRIEWLFSSLSYPVEDRVLNYTVTIPQNANGTYAFSGLVDLGGGNTYPSTGDAQLHVSIGCELAGDTPPCDTVTLSEVIDGINDWTIGEMTLTDVISLINAWIQSVT